MAKRINKLATKGLVGWHVQAVEDENCTSSGGPYDAPPGDCIAIDMSEVYQRDGIGASQHNIWRRPSLDLLLPDNNVRSLFEGCIGHEGSTKGHAWDGKLESLQSMDSVGLAVYVEVLKAAGGKVVSS